MPEDLLPNDDPAPTPRPADKPRYLQCDFCGCRLTRDGEVMTLGDKAKEHQRHERTLGDRDERITELEKENRDLRARVAELSTHARGKEWGLVV